MKKLLQHSIEILNNREKKKFLTIVVLDVLVSALDIIFLALLLLIIQIYTHPATNLPSFLPGWLVDRNSLVPILSFIVLFALKNAAALMIYRTQCRFLCATSSRLSQDMLQEYLDGPFSNYVSIDSSIHIRKINHQPIEFSHHILGGMQQMITQVALISFAVIAILLYKAKVFLLLLLLLVPPVFALIFLTKKKLRSVKAYMKKSSDKSLQHLQEALSGYVESNVYNKNEFFVKRYMDYQKKFANSHSELLIVQGIPSRVIEIVALIGLFVLIAIDKWTANADSVMIITIGAFMAAAYKIIPGVVKILNINSEIQTYAQVVPDLHRQRRPEKASTATAEERIQSIQFNNVSFRFHEKPLFEKLNLEIHHGDFVGISGLSGKGKTTILNLLLGFLSPDAGDIKVNGRAATNGSLRQYWPAISYVKQQNFLIHDTITENVTMSNGSSNSKILDKAIDAAGLTRLIESFHEGMNKIIMENGKNISGGQRQRIAIARSLYKDADLIILDEPFNELDEVSEQCLLEHFQELVKTGKMAILITHDKKSLSFCNKIISLDEQ